LGAEEIMRLADKIRTYSRKRFVVPALEKRVPRFSIRAGDVVHELGIGGQRAPAVCSALKTKQFLRDNHLRLLEAKGPKSGQSTTVTYTYEFVEGDGVATQADAWTKLRGALKDVFVELGGGEAYLRSERRTFHGPEDRE
jgi:hypothetical protein